MAKDRSHFPSFDTPYEVQPPKGSAEPSINYGGVAETASDTPNDPMGVMPSQAKPKNIGPAGGEG
jgi:hypothetical protein